MGDLNSYNFFLFWLPRAVSKIIILKDNFELMVLNGLLLYGDKKIKSNHKLIYSTAKEILKVLEKLMSP